MRASGLVASLRDEAVAGVVIVCPSTQQPCGYSTNVKRYGGATRRRWRRIPGQRRPRRRSAAMRAVATKSLIFWPRVCWPEGCFFGHWRSEMAFPLVTGGATRRAVRKHRAPKGALRHSKTIILRPVLKVRQKAPSAKRCIKTMETPSANRQTTLSQKAPSAKRCIKTGCSSPLRSTRRRVRKHRAPKGALRPGATPFPRPTSPLSVRKHRAPKGALRRSSNEERTRRSVRRSESTERQKVH